MNYYFYYDIKMYILLKFIIFEIIIPVINQLIIIEFYAIIGFKIQMSFLKYKWNRKIFLINIDYFLFSSQVSWFVFE